MWTNCPSLRHSPATLSVVTFRCSLMAPWGRVDPLGFPFTRLLPLAAYRGESIILPTSDHTRFRPRRWRQTHGVLLAPHNAGARHSASFVLFSYLHSSAYNIYGTHTLESSKHVRDILPISGYRVVTYVSLVPPRTVPGLPPTLLHTTSLRRMSQHLKEQIACNGVLFAHLVGICIRASLLDPGSDLGASSLPRPPRLGALRAVPRHPIRALALFRAVPRAGATSGAVAAPLEMLLRARRHHGQAGGRHAARAATSPAEHCERLSKVRAAVGAKTRNVERSGPRIVPVGRMGSDVSAVGSALEEQLGDAGV